MPAAKAQVSFGVLVHTGPLPSAKAQVSFGTLVHSGTDAPPVGSESLGPDTSPPWGFGDEGTEQTANDTTWGFE